MKVKLPTHEEIYQWLISIGIFCPIGIESSILLLLFLWTFRINHSVKLNKSLLCIIIGICLISLFQINKVDYSYNKFFQQFTFCSFYLVAYFNIIKSQYFNANKIFYKIYKISIGLSWIGIFQFLIAFFFSIQLFGSNYYLRVTSLLEEPGYLARCLFPALSYMILTKSWRQEKLNMIVLLVCFILTQSAVGYIVLLVFILYNLFFYGKYRYFFRVTLCACIIILIVFGSNAITKTHNIDNDVITKTIDTFTQFKDFDPSVFETLNLSSYALLTNLSVSINSPQRILGTGFGTHSQNYFKTTNYSTFHFYGLNSDDAYSLAIRLYSELGVFLLLFIFGIFKKLNTKDFISVSLFFTIIFILLRGGHYSQYGTIFLILLYFMRSDENKVTY